MKSNPLAGVPAASAAMAVFAQYTVMAALAALSALTAPLPAAADDIDTLAARYLASFMADTRTPTDAQVRANMTALRADGTWPDIDLSLTEQVNWTPRNHIDRMAQSARAYVAPGHALAGNAELAAKISLALDAYLKKDPKSTNWWYNEIGAQLSLGPLAYLWREHLTAAQKAGTDSILARSWRTKQRTGQNLVWVSGITLWLGALNRDAAQIKAAAEAIAGTILITSSEGIQPDFSFHQHGAQLYSGGYGSGYASDGASTAYDLRGTRFAFTPAQTAILAAYLLDGERWMTRGSTLDHSVRGREITRSGISSANTIATAALDLAPLVPASAADLNAYAANVKAQNGSSVDGARWFWRSEYLAHHRKGHFISLRMASKRLQASEVVNQEGLLSQYLADGATYLYRTGKEYDGAFPVWDWCHVPGTTAIHAADPPAMKNPSPGAGEFAGGVTDGSFAGAAFQYSKLGLDANKAWFLFRNEMIAMGHGISSIDPGEVHTTVNQCLLKAPIQIATGTPAAPVLQELAPGSALPPSFQWILHDRIGYVFNAPIDQDVHVPHLDAGKVSGNWRRINASQSEANVDQNMFNLWIQHGAKPSASRYIYTTLMDVGPEDMQAYAKAPTITVIRNQPTLMAARHAPSGATLAAFFAPQALTVGARYTLTPDRACLMLIREEQDKMVLAVSDPKRGTADLIVKADIKLTGPGAVWSEADKTTTVTFPLPKGDSAGATTLRTFATTGVALRPTAAQAGFTLTAMRTPTRTASGSALPYAITYRIPAPGMVELSLITAQGRILSETSVARATAGTHRWMPVSSKSESRHAGTETLFVRLEWNGRHIVAPVPGGQR
jgi:chondroitin AC lyase